jgi:hypothetical protein
MKRKCKYCEHEMYHEGEPMIVENYDEKEAKILANHWGNHKKGSYPLPKNFKKLKTIYE